MMLDDRHIDKPVGLDNVLEDPPFADELSSDIHPDVVFFIGQNDGAAGLFDRLTDAGAQKCPAGFIAGDIGDDYLRGSGGQAELDHLADQNRVGVGGLFGGAIPADIRLDRHFLAFGHKPFDAADSIKGCVQSSRMISVFGQDDFGKILVGRDFEIGRFGHQFFGGIDLPVMK